MSDLPNWPGADVCYSRAYRLLEKMAAAGHVTRVKHGRRYRCEVSQEMRDLITALDRGDEEYIKGTLLVARA